MLVKLASFSPTNVKTEDQFRGLPSTNNAKKDRKLSIVLETQKLGLCMTTTSQHKGVFNLINRQNYDTITEHYI